MIKFLFFFFFLFQTLISSQTVPTSSSSHSGLNDQWHLLQENIGISAMHMQLLHDNKVVMFDRTDFGSSNISLPGGICRHDPTDTALKYDCSAHSVLYDIITNTFRPLMVQTDTWCSSGAVLPNGTLVQTGGYNDGERVVRSFTPCSNEYCDWTEFPLSLSERRWYATNQILPDGRIIVIGGRREYSFEFYPRESVSSQAIGMNFLRNTRDNRNMENNLYPFVHLLPDGNLFIFANTQSIVFNYKRNRVLKELPRIPGEDPRNYPSSGSSVLLPLDETKGNNVEAEIMICGGAPMNSFLLAMQNGTFVRAVSTCGRLKVISNDGDRDRNPKWTMQNMPLARVMGDMIILPTGDLIIINGADLGTAGWELARGPVRRPIIYYPSDHRFSVMSSSSKPRMYHSTAVLITDGRILIGGSNTHVYYNFSNEEFPTDLSLEAYSPPYLAMRHVPLRPIISTVDDVLGYGKTFRLRFVVREFLNQNVLSVRIVAPSFTTHSFGMNQRMVVLKTADVKRVTADSSDEYDVRVTGPSTAEIAPPGYYLMFVVHAGIPSGGTWVKIQ